MNEKLLNEELAKDLLLEQTFVGSEDVYRSAPKPKQEVKLLEEQDTNLSGESTQPEFTGIFWYLSWLWGIIRGLHAFLWDLFGEERK